MPRGGRDIPPASRRRGRPAAGRQPAPAPARGLQAGTAPDTRQFRTQCREIHDKRFDNDRVLATPPDGYGSTSAIRASASPRRNAPRFSTGSTRSTPSRRAPGSGCRSARTSPNSSAAVSASIPPSARGRASGSKSRPENSPLRADAATDGIGAILHAFQIFFISLQVVGKRGIFPALPAMPAYDPERNKKHIYHEIQ